MSETAKTLAFVAVAVLAIGAAAFSRSTVEAPNAQQFVGTYLYKDIDVAAPRRLQISKFDRQTATVRQFEVAELDGVWSIPSKDNYPADATQQMAEAATCLMDRKILRVAGGSGQSHEEFGVIDPLAAKLNSRSVGVGAHVTMTDAEEKPLVDLIIGKAVKDNPGQRYVRRANQDVVFVVDLDASKLTTDFADWIEDDLLKLNAMDLRKAYIHDYSADLSISMTAQGLSPQIRWAPRGEITLQRNEQTAPWEVATLKKFDRQSGDPETGMAPDAVADDEEVDQDAVQKLVDGLDQLLIVDVARKPAGLSADLKAGEAFLTKEEAVGDLVRRGFIPGREGSGADMLASEGELVCTLRNGVEYVMRFGQLQVQTESDAPADVDETATAKPTASATAAADATTGDAAAGAPDETTAEATGESAGDAAADGAPAADAATPAAEDSKDAKNLRRYLFVMARFDEDAVEKPAYKELPELPAEEPAAEGDAAAESTEPVASAEAASASQTENNAADGADESEDATDDQAKKDRDAILAERKQIEEENDHLREDYEALISAGQEEVARLNARFGDWYFVISNDVFKQIHLGRDQVIKKKTPPAGEAGAEATEEPSATSGLPDLGGAAAAPEQAQ